MINLEKGQRISLEKAAPGLTKALIGLGWDARSTDGGDFDLDASAILVDANNKCSGADNFLFYNTPNLSLHNGALIHTGDNRTGAGDGDDEQLKIDLSRIPADIQKIIIVVTIHDAPARRQSFGQVQNAYCRVVNDESGQEALRFDLSEDASTETAMIFAEIYRREGSWSFNAVGQGMAGGLQAVIAQYGL